MTCSATKPDTAILKFVGTNILLYQSQDAIAPPNGFTDPEIAAFGIVFDQTLYPIDVNAFGAPTRHRRQRSRHDPDHPEGQRAHSEGGLPVAGLRRRILLRGRSHSGISRVRTQASSTTPSHPIRRAPSAVRTQDRGANVNGGIFLHETLHMINFGVKILDHGLADTEEEFLDEGMAKVAEELGREALRGALSRRRRGARTRRNSSPTPPKGSSAATSTTRTPTCSRRAARRRRPRVIGGSDLPEAGAEWLFLRWLGDQRGEAIYRQIVQSALTGVPNIEAQTGEPFASLFAKAGLTLYTDSIPGLARDQVPAAYRLTSRNIRQLNDAIYDAIGGPTAQFPRPFALQPQSALGDVALQGA